MKVKKLLRYNPIAMLVRILINAELRAMLEDIDYRIKLLDGSGRIGSHQLTLKHHILDGFTFTDNSPTAGKIAWSDCHIVYEGNDYTITNGSTPETTHKYVWWDKSLSTTTFQTSITKPTVTDEDCLVCINDGGVHRLVIGQGKMQHAAFLLGASINSDEIANSAIIAQLLGSGSVVEAKLGTGAVTVDKIGTGAVTETKVGATAITEGKIATGAVTEGKLGDLAVTAAKIQNLTVTGAKAAAGTFNSTKLNLLAHLLY